MAITSITEQGKAFIRSVCEGIGSSLLNGKNNEGSLPYCYPETSPSKVWYSQAKYNGTLIKTNQEISNGPKCNSSTSICRIWI